MPNLKFGFFGPVVVLALGLSGCALPGGRSPGFAPAVRSIAASFVAARAFDRTKLAMRRDNTAGLESAGNEMSRAAGAGSNPQLVGALVTTLAAQAGQLAVRSTLSSGDDRIRLEESSNARYRSALAFAPEQKPEKILDAQALNALGYFLADKGSTREDFERAAILTKAAYQNWDLSGADSDSNQAGRARLAGDSYAWALFKLGKYPAALAQQEKVWDMVRGLGDSTASAEIPFHLAEIYRALDQDKKARQTYEAALALTTSNSMRILIESRLQVLELARV